MRSGRDALHLEPVMWSGAFAAASKAPRSDPALISRQRRDVAQAEELLSAGRESAFAGRLRPPGYDGFWAALSSPWTHVPVASVGSLLPRMHG